SHRQHLAVLVDSRVVGVVGLATKKLSLQFFWAALVAIVSFYGVLRGIRVTLRGLRTESILKPPRADVGLIYNFAVASSMRGHGLGRALFSHACEHCRTLQLGRIGLDVARTNVRARAL